MITDYIVAGALLYYLYSGWRNGALKTLLGPIAMVMGCLLGFIYYLRTHHFGTSLLICVLSPFALKWLGALALGLWNKTGNKVIPPSFVSRLFACALSVLWYGSYVVLILILIGFLPVRLRWFKAVRGDALASKSYRTIQGFLGEKMPAAAGDIEKVAAILKSPEKFRHFQTTQEFKAVAEDGKLGEIFADEEIAALIERHDYIKLMGNPKIQALMQNEELLKKMFALNKKIMEESPEGESTEAPMKNPPKVISIE
jgi:hypothetical protein